MATNDLHHLDFIQTRTLGDMNELEDRLSLLPSPSTSSSEKCKQNDSPQSKPGSIPASPRTIQDMAPPSTIHPPTISETSRPKRHHRVFGNRQPKVSKAPMRPTPDEINRRNPTISGTSRPKRYHRVFGNRNRQPKVSKAPMRPTPEELNRLATAERAIRDQRIRESRIIRDRSEKRWDVMAWLV